MPLPTTTSDATLNQRPRPSRLGRLAHSELAGSVCVADGADAVLQGAREQLMRGASQLKLMAGGGVASPYDPLDVTQYTQPELRAAVDAAEKREVRALRDATRSESIDGRQPLGAPPQPGMAWIPAGAFTLGANDHYPEEPPADFGCFHLARRCIG
jgi:hypothetical protein